jgi:hypothetical protein
LLVTSELRNMIDQRDEKSAPPVLDFTRKEQELC